ncbi:hypothetical protein GWI33_015437 [Rhynchophorus ferrugineus]|uniref:rRNA methyltransferase 2, mitochondrial n=1 Tax=Rhynchophorus ferrugineus TaxID=354439 RepID=A0A834I389_RHYFE|nr:hypothetical protein GWI33_015437 [Rhynchophorus ferrugineus]
MRLSRILISQVRCFNSTNTYLKISTNNLKTKNKGVSSNHWLSRQLSDPYVEKAKLMNYRCRSAFKLLEIDEKHHILKPGFIVIDCGASPGSWTQIAVKKVNADGSDNNSVKGKVISIDRQLLYPIEGAIILGNTDFTEASSQDKVAKELGGAKVDCVLSDMAPNATGIPDLDHENIIKLCYSVLKFALKHSNVGGSVLVKLWQCGDTKQLISDMEKFYRSVKSIKPKSSRSDSAEIFLLGREFKGLKVT